MTENENELPKFNDGEYEKTKEERDGEKTNNQNEENSTISSEVSPSEKTMGMLCHLLALCGLIGIPFGNILGPLILWLIKKDESEFINTCGKDSINFQITIMIGVLICVPLVFVLIGFIGIAALAIFDLVCLIKGAIAANKGEIYQYPYKIKFIK